MANTDHWYLALLGLAESFRVSSPPNMKLCIHCLQSILNFQPPPRIEARTHLQLGTILLYYTKNASLAKVHLERAWTLAYPEPSFDDVRFEALCLLAEYHEVNNDSANAKQTLQKGLEISQPVPYWKCRLLFQLAQIHVREHDMATAGSLLGHGADYAGSVSSPHTQTLFLLSKGLCLLQVHNYVELHQVMSFCCQLIDQFPSTLANGMVNCNKESLRAFFLTLQVCHYLAAGQIKSTKPTLKQLQECIQLLTTAEAAAMSMQPQSQVPVMQTQEPFQWLSKEHLCVLVYLVTVLHSVLAGYLDKAQKYAEKALMQIEQLKTLDLVGNPLLASFQLMLLENIIICKLLTGKKADAAVMISHFKHVSTFSPAFFQKHNAQLHTLIGLYAMSMNCLEPAAAQFNRALQVCMDSSLWMFINLNLAIVYMRLGRQSEVIALLEQVNPQRVVCNSQSLRAAAMFVNGLRHFFQTEYNESKYFLREGLKLANAEDLNRLTACCLVLLGHLFLTVGSTQEAVNMVTPALQLAERIPDAHIQLWGSALMRDVYRLCGDQAGEMREYASHQRQTELIWQDHCLAQRRPEHSLIEWLGDVLPSGWSGGPSQSQTMQGAAAAGHGGLG